MRALARSLNEVIRSISTISKCLNPRRWQRLTAHEFTGRAGGVARIRPPPCKAEAEGEE